MIGTRKRWKIVDLYVVLKVQLKGLCLFCNLGDWSNGMIGVSKTFGGGSIPSSPAQLVVENLEKSRLSAIFILGKIVRYSKRY